MAKVEVLLPIMMLYKATFRKKSSVSADEAESCVLMYMGALFLNGQACDDYQYGWLNDELVVTTYIPDQGALSMRQAPTYVKNAFREMRAVLSEDPHWEPLATKRQTSVTTYRRAPFLYLFTTALSIDPPVHCGHDGKSVPTFRLPLELTKREELYRWSESYSDHDSIWLGSGALEKVAYRELTSLDSDLTTEGRELCRDIEAATHKPTYYYLMHYHKSKKEPSQRPCPGCGKAWHAHPKKEDQPFWEFHFKCDACRLVSHHAV